MTLQALRFDRIYEREQAQLWNIRKTREKQSFGFRQKKAMAHIYAGV